MAMLNKTITVIISITSVLAAVPTSALEEDASNLLPSIEVNMFAIDEMVQNRQQVHNKAQAKTMPNKDRDGQSQTRPNPSPTERSITSEPSITYTRNNVETIPSAPIITNISQLNQLKQDLSMVTKDGNSVDNDLPPKEQFNNSQEQLNNYSTISSLIRFLTKNREEPPTEQSQLENTSISTAKGINEKTPYETIMVPHNKPLYKMQKTLFSTTEPETNTTKAPEESTYTLNNLEEDDSYIEFLQHYDEQESTDNDIPSTRTSTMDTQASKPNKPVEKAETMTSNTPSELFIQRPKFIDQNNKITERRTRTAEQVITYKNPHPPPKVILEDIR